MLGNSPACIRAISVVAAGGSAALLCAWLTTKRVTMFELRNDGIHWKPIFGSPQMIRWSAVEAAAWTTRWQDFFYPFLKRPKFSGVFQISPWIVNVRFLLREIQNRGIAAPSMRQSCYRHVRRRDNLLNAAFLTAYAFLLLAGIPLLTKTEQVIFASMNGNTTSLKFAMFCGLNPNSAMDGKTALMAASAFGHLASAELLNESGADVNRQSPEGYTALMAASWRRHVEIVRLLLKAGADPGVSGRDGKTSLGFAKKAGDRLIASILKGALNKRRLNGRRVTAEAR